MNLQQNDLPLLTECKDRKEDRKEDRKDDNITITISIPECPVCLSNTDDALSITNCNHLLCIECLTELYNQHNYTMLCPLCRATTNDIKMNHFLERTQIPPACYVQFRDDSSNTVVLPVSVPYTRREFTYCLIATAIAPVLYIFWFNT